MPNSIFFAIRLVPMLSVMGTIFFLSHQTGSELHLPPILFLDKIGHFFLYAMLAVATFWVPSKNLQKRKPKMVVIIIVLFCFFYGMTDEFHQSFIDGRYASYSDLVADLSGILFVSCFWWRRNSAGLA